MAKRTNRILILLLFAAPLFAVGPMLGNAFVQSKQGVPRPQNKQELTDAQVKQLLLLRDTDKNGKISKQEWMNFMAAEFDGLDKDKSGDLDAKDLAESRLLVSTFAKTGK